MTDTPNPGSDEAVKLGCLCPTMDNAKGRGAWGSEGEDAIFWIVPSCPLHGADDVSPAMDRLAFAKRKDE